jgi:hypothetical protein
MYFHLYPPALFLSPLHTDEILLIPVNNTASLTELKISIIFPVNKYNYKIYSYFIVNFLHKRHSRIDKILCNQPQYKLLMEECTILPHQ